MTDVFVEHLLGHAGARGGALAVADPGGELTWRELAAAVRDRAAALPTARDVTVPVAVLHRRGDVRWLVDFLALRHNGLTVVCFPGAIPAASVERQAAGYAATVLVTDDGCAVHPREARGEPWWRRTTLVHLTSGTTGTASGVPRGEENLLHEAGSVAEGLELTPGTPLLCGTPTAHSFAGGLFLAALVTGAPTLVLPAFDVAEAAELAARHRPHVLCGTPYVFRALLRTARSRQDVLSDIRIPLTGGAPLHAELADVWGEVTGVPLVQEYGLSEGGIATANLSHAAERPTAVGRPLPGVEVVVVRGDGTPVPAGTEGHVCVRRKDCPAHYLTPDGDLLPIGGRVPGEDGTVDTGDLGRLDEDGLLHLTGRVKSLINVAGTKVSPRSVESALMEHPGVHDAVVVGVPDDQHGERVAAVVEADPAEVTPASLGAHMRQRVSAPLVPRLWHVLPRLPRTASGKPNVRKIRSTIDEGR